ncbi:MAG: glycosyltransferase [Phycisphaerae bacterium]|nr:glycosyltransferase [Phycisphaerae bacterium]
MGNGIEIILWVGAALWSVFLLQFIVNWILVRDVSRIEITPPDEWPFVSIVVPARDEERGIGAAVRSFCKQDYPGLEVIVVDDGSSDATPQILAELQAEFLNLTVIPGQDPPAGWLGKPNALEIGRKRAKGDWLLFVDADVVYAPDLVRRAICHALCEEAGMLFAYPCLGTRGVFEAAIMSALYLVPFAVFPTFLVSRTKSRLFAQGGGVFNLVRRDALEACGAFGCLKSAVIDDIGLGYAVKRAGFKETVVMAGPLIRLRMYESARETIEGFTKNLYHFLRMRPWGLPLPFVAGTVLSLLPYYGFAVALACGSVSVPASISLVCMHTVLGLIARVFRQPWYIAFLNPLRELCWWWILIRSLVRYRRHGVVWRGRKYEDI